MSQATDRSIVVETRLGRVQGVTANGHLAFLGVPFARPPVGPLRFRPPEPVEPWAGVWPAVQRGPLAPQLPFRKDGPPTPEGDEDCLYLDVRTPSVSPGRHPVLVWLHGGAFHAGTSDVIALLPLAETGNERLAQQGIVVVSVTYRLGALGWLALDRVDPAFAGSGNNGLLDQIAALDWVQTNIERFGGDPDNVTVAGASAGAIAAATLLAGPGLGRFQRAALMSGAASSTKSLDRAADITTAYLDLLAVDTVDALRGLPVDDLLRAQFAVTRQAATLLPRPDTFLPFGPVVDNVVLHDDPLDAARRGVGCEVPVMLGSNDDEFTNVAIRPGDRDIRRRDLVQALADPAAESIVDAYLDQQPPDHDLGAVYDRIRSDRVFRLPAIDLADARATHTAPTYRYICARRHDADTASHGMQVGLFWGLYDGPRWADVSRAMSTYFTTFVEHGVPSGPPAAPEWPSYGSRRRTMLFSDQNRVLADPDADIRRRWQQVS